MGVVETARELADELLFPAALATDAADSVPASHLDEFASRGLYGLSGPTNTEGLGVDRSTLLTVIETLAGGCLSTTFLWQQHLMLVATLAETSTALSREWLTPLCRGERRAGVAFAHLRRPGPPAVAAQPDGSGWRLTGSAPWVTGWGRIDVVRFGATLPDGNIVWCLVDAEEGGAVSVSRLSLSVLNATSTVEMHLDGLYVPGDRVASIEPMREFVQRDAAGLRTNGSLALGLTARCLRLVPTLKFADELRQCRCVLDHADIDSLPSARAWSSELAMRATSALVVAGGGRSLSLQSHAQRLCREAMFLLVQGQTTSIRAAQLERLARAVDYDALDDPTP